MQLPRAALKITTALRDKPRLAAWRRLRCGTRGAGQSSGAGISAPDAPAFRHAAQTGHSRHSRTDQGARGMQTLTKTSGRATDLYRLAFLLTGERDLSIEVTVEVVDLASGNNPFFANWMIGWSRRLVIAKALAARR